MLSGSAAPACSQVCSGDGAPDLFGAHEGVLFEHAPTGRRIEYAGVAMFTMAAGKITKVWVLGDRTAWIEQITSAC